MRDIIIGIGDLFACKDVNMVLKTFALGSCVAVTIYDQQNQTGAMVHIALSDSKVNEEKSLAKPGYFVNTAIPALIKKIKKIHPSFQPSNCIVKLIGGASVLNDENFFNIGQKNITTAKKLLSHYGFKISGEDTGGKISRTVTLSIETGKVVISNAEIGKWEI